MQGDSRWRPAAVSGPVSGASVHRASSADRLTRLWLREPGTRYQHLYYTRRLMPIRCYRHTTLNVQVRTSAAAAAAAFGSFPLFPSPSVLAGPPTFGFAFATLLGTLALVAGVGAEPRVRPWPSKLSLDGLPQRLPIENVAPMVRV